MLQQQRDDGGRLPDRARALLAASQKAGCPIAFIDRHARRAEDEQEAVRSGNVALSMAALSRMSEQICLLEDRIDEWLCAHAATCDARRAAIAYWRGRLPYLDEDGKVDEAAYLAALGSAIAAPPPEEDEEPGCGARGRAAGRGGRAAADLDPDSLPVAALRPRRIDRESLRRAARGYDPARIEGQLAAMTARTAPAESAEAMLAAEGLEGSGALMPPPTHERALPAREEVLSGMLAGEPLCLWLAFKKRAPSPDPLPPPFWQSRPAQTAALVRRLAAQAGAAVGGQGPAWARPAGEWAEAQRRAWGDGAFSAEEAFAEAKRAGSSAFSAAAAQPRRSRAIDDESLHDARRDGGQAAASCFAAQMAATLAPTLAESIRARAPDSLGAAPLTASRMQMLASAKPPNPGF